MGLSEIPPAGEFFTVVKTEKEARARAQQHTENHLKPAEERQAITLESFFSLVQDGKTKELLLILKVDVQGSLEPLVNSLKEIKVEPISLKILHAEAGAITENDVNLAVSTGAIILGFQVEADGAARKIAGMALPAKLPTPTGWKSALIA